MRVLLGQSPHFQGGKTKTQMRKGIALSEPAMVGNKSGSLFPN